MRITGSTLAIIRAGWKLSQVEFWRPFGVTQSAASRYENDGRTLPPPLRKLITLVFKRTHKRKSFLALAKRIAEF